MYGADADTFLKFFPASTDAEAREIGAIAAREGIVGRSARNWALVEAKSGSAPPPPRRASQDPRLLRIFGISEDANLRLLPSPGTYGGQLLCVGPCPATRAG
jgi:hypothetical protein